MPHNPKGLVWQRILVAADKVLVAQSVLAGEKEDRNDNDDNRNNRPHSAPSSPGSLKLFEMRRELMPVLGSCSVKNCMHFIAAAAEGQEASA